MGGAIFNEGGTVIITNSTFAGNTAQGGLGGAGGRSGSASNGTAGQGLGAALFNHDGTITVSDSTFSNNSVVQGDGSTLIAAGRDIFNYADSSTASETTNNGIFTETITVTIAYNANALIYNTILGQSDNTVEDFTSTNDGTGKTITYGYGDLIRKESGFVGSIASTRDPLLGSLAYNGGPTQTMALQSGSPAIDAGINAGIPAGVTTDQRGQPRIVNGIVDIGAFESKIPQTITFGTLANKTYGNADFAISATASSGLPVTFTASGNATVQQVGGVWDVHITGAGTATITASQAGNANYDPAPAVTQTFQINPATLTYTATATNRLYGAANPSLTGKVTGFVLGQTQATATTGTLAFTTTATASSNAGSYAITGSGLTANHGNYVFAQAAANATALTIKPATLTYTATAASRLYGAANPTFTGIVGGFVLGQTQATATTGTLAFTTTATPSSAVGSYAITGSGLTANNGNYVFVQAAGNATALTINAVTTANLQSTLASQASVTLQVASSELTADISAINALTAPSSPVTITLNLTTGSYTGQVVSPPKNVTLVISGAGSSVTFVGHSPAFTVTTGTVIVQQATFSQSTNNPTILVSGGSLTLRGDTVQESTAGNQPDLLITGGTVDLGTAANPGKNTFNVNGPGLLLRNTGPNPVSALGDTFQANGAALTDPYRIADLIDDGLDVSGHGLVTFVAQNAFVTKASPSIQQAVNLVPTGYTINVQGGGHYDSYTVGAKLLTVAFQNGPTLQLVSDAAFGPKTTTLRVTGGPQDNTHIDIGRGAGTATVAVDINGYPDGTFAPTGGLVVHGGGGQKAHIEVDSQVTLPALLFADGADAHLQGGGGPTVEVGGGGQNTHLEGGQAGSILIAGTGAAHLEGHSGNDLLIGGTTAFDANEAALLAVLAEWDSGASYLQRIADLQDAPVTVNGQTVNPDGGYTAGYYLNGATVKDNGVTDHLAGAGARDWYFASLGDKIDKHSKGEVITTIS
jgi:hypothetical protein